MVAPHHRFIRPRKPEPVSSKKRSPTSSTSSAAPEPTDIEVGNLAAPKLTTTQKTKSAKFTSAKSGATETETTDSSAPTSGT
ncbi:hypothetical protein FRC06_009502, partial [Ceratobasidium sp. 370]